MSRVVIEASTSFLASSNSASSNPALSLNVASSTFSTSTSTPSSISYFNINGTRTRWKRPPSRISKVGGRVLVCAIEDIPADLEMEMTLTGKGTVIIEQEEKEETVEDREIIFVIISSAPAPISAAHQPVPELEPTTTHHSQMARVLRLHLESGKKGQYTFLHNTLPRSLSFISHHLTQNQSRSICIACETGKDASVGVALMALQVWFDDRGRLRDQAAQEDLKATKQSIRTRLEWIIESRYMVNPSRTTLKRVNDFLLSPFARRMYDKS